MIIAWLLLKSNDFVVKRVKTALLFNDKYKQGYSYIMANPITAEEWRQVAANAQAQIVAVNQQKAQGEEQITALEQQLLANGQQISDYLKANPRITSRDPGLLALQAQTDTIKQNLAKTEVYVRATLTSQLFQLRATINNANRQADIASSGTPDTNTNTPPESTVPDQSNTEVTTTPEQPIENSAPADITDPNADEFAGIDEQIAANENALQEPPLLSNEEVDNYFLELQGEEIENRDPAIINDDENVFNPGTTFNAGEESVFDPTGNAGAPQGLTKSLASTRGAATAQDVSNFKQKEDWRVRLSLAPSATYLYKETDKEKRGILDPLVSTDGVLFPYTPAISVQYAAHYDQTELTHSNYKYFQYKSSSVDQISITCDFTAQDTSEARYLLAVIHFFRSVTKMFYGQDNGPKPGTPPPLCYLSGLGAFQFDAHPLAITAFTYNLPTDVDYIRAGSVSAEAGVNQSRSNYPVNTSSATNSRLGQSSLNVGATTGNPIWSYSASSQKPTYVPTKMQMQITAVPIVTRYDISNKFSLAAYGTGQLLQGTQRAGGGIW